MNPNPLSELEGLDVLRWFKGVMPGRTPEKELLRFCSRYRPEELLVLRELIFDKGAAVQKLNVDSFFNWHGGRKAFHHAINKKTVYLPACSRMALLVIDGEYVMLRDVPHYADDTPEFSAKFGLSYERLPENLTPAASRCISYLLRRIPSVHPPIEVADLSSPATVMAFLERQTDIHASFFKFYDRSDLILVGHFRHHPWELGLKQNLLVRLGPPGDWPYWVEDVVNRYLDRFRI